MCFPLPSQWPQNIGNTCRLQDTSTDKCLFSDLPVFITTPTTREGCKYCFIQIPCNCALTIDHFNILPRIQNCMHSPNVTKIYPFNLALLQFFFSDNDLGDVIGDTSYAYPLNYTIPNFNIYQHHFTQLLASDQALRLNLSKMVQAAKLNQSVYSNLVEPILSGAFPAPPTQSNKK